MVKLENYAKKNPPDKSLKDCMINSKNKYYLSSLSIDTVATVLNPKCSNEESRLEAILEDIL